MLDRSWGEQTFLAIVAVLLMSTLPKALAAGHDAMGVLSLLQLVDILAVGCGAGLMSGDRKGHGWGLGLFIGGLISFVPGNILAVLIVASLAG